VGHDLVLLVECLASVTPLVVKDRALDHHTVAALRPGAATAGRDISSQGATNRALAGTTHGRRTTPNEEGGTPS
jgi:hypothetical protein